MIPDPRPFVKLLERLVEAAESIADDVEQLRQFCERAEAAAESPSDALSSEHPT